MTRRRRRVPRLGLLAWVVVVLVATGLVALWDSDQPESESLGQETSSHPTEQPRSAAPGQRHRTLAPVALEIPEINVATRLERLGVKPDRTVDVPVDPDNAGWFRLGPKPGQLGSSVILGHVDSVAGPAVFARLGELDRGDAVMIGRADGSVVEFVVKRAVTYPNAEFPAQRVYAAQGVRRLNLVTCTGEYDADRGGYQSNLVVYTERAENGDTAGLGA